MARELITTWGDYQTAIDRLLTMACDEIWIFDADLAHLRLNTAPRLDQLKRVLKAGNNGPRLQIALRNAGPLRREHPALMSLLGVYGHLMTVQETAPQIAHLRDSLIIIDGSHGLVRFEQDMPRSKLLINEGDELRPYRARFREILAEGGTPVSSMQLGL